MIKEHYIFNILWLDDSLKTIEYTRPHLEDAFLKYYQSKPNFIIANDYFRFLDLYEESKKKIDYIFLDIDLGPSKYSGIDAYRKIREVDQNVIIAFLSANLLNPKYEILVEDLEITDKNLFILSLPFPSKRSRIEYQEEVLYPVENMIKRLEYLKNRSHNQFFNTKLDKFYGFSENIQDKIYLRANALSKSFVAKVFEENKDVSSIVIGHHPNNVIIKGLNGKPLNSKLVTEYSKLYGTMTIGYNRIDQNNNFELVKPEIASPKSTEIIHAQILEIDKKEGYVILNCLLDDQEKQFQIRKFDIEPMEGAVVLELNHIITVTVHTYQGERVFSFKDGEEGLKEKFGRKRHIDVSKYDDIFTPIEPEEDEDYF